MQGKHIVIISAIRQSPGNGQLDYTLILLEIFVSIDPHGALIEEEQ